MVKRKLVDGGSMKNGENNMNRKKKCISGYFTVEASMVMPVVLVCYLFIIVLLCYIYERSVLEQNACRLPVWEEYVEGYLNLYPKNAGETSKDRIYEYILNRLNDEEGDQYLFGQSVKADVTVRGEKVMVERSFLYTQFGGWEHEFTAACYCPDPEDYIRTMNMLEDKLAEETEDDEEVAEEQNERLEEAK